MPQLRQHAGLLVARAFLLGALAACSSPAPRVDPEPLFAKLQTGSTVEAMEAIEELAQNWDDRMLPRLESLLLGPPRAAMRALHLAGELATEGSARLLLEKLPLLFASPDPQVARMAVVAAGRRRLRPATSAILDGFEKSGEKAALRALGRIWEQALDAPPLPRAAEIERLSVLRLVHRLAMGADTSVEACEAMLRAMTRAELEDFLAKHAGERFVSRRPCDEAVRRKDFDPARGALIHESLLSSPDVALVAGILASSPHALRELLVRSFLDDRRAVKGDDLLCDAAATRLSRKSPAARSERDALIRSLQR